MRNAVDQSYFLYLYVYIACCVSASYADLGICGEYNLLAGHSTFCSFGDVM